VARAGSLQRHRQSERRCAVNINFDRGLALIALICSLGGGYAGYKVTQHDVETQGAEISTLRTQLVAEHDAHQDQKTRIALIEASFVQLNAKLDDLKADMKEIKSSVVFARGRER
jgi:uncharacterized protein HemX